jgi:hypothetical protein
MVFVVTLELAVKLQRRAVEILLGEMLLGVVRLPVGSAGEARRGWVLGLGIQPVLHLVYLLVNCPCDCGL